MESGDLLDQLRLDLRDTVQTYLWSDAELYRYIDEAQKMFCRLTGGLADATSEVARMELVAGERFATLSPLVLKLRAAFNADGKKIEIVNFEDLEFDDSKGLPLFTDTPGVVNKLVVGMEPNQVRVINTPTEDATLSLIVYRLPLEEIEGSGQDLEIDEQHHIAILKWARYLAHMKPDAETYDRGRATQYKAEFEQYCFMAKGEKGQREHKYRGMQFSW
jgi:hypothetical protein